MSEKEIEPVVPEEEIELVSKSELKREMHAMQELAERLVGLKPQIWEQFVFSDIMKDALEESLRKRVIRPWEICWIFVLMRTDSTFVNLFAQVRTKSRKVSRPPHKENYSNISKN